MKKKISVLLFILIMSLSFAGCSDKKNDAATYDSSTLEQSAEFIISNFSSMDDDTLDSFKEASDFQLDYTMMQTGLKITGESFIGMIDAWQAAEQECGEYVSHGDYEIAEKADEYVVSTSVKYKDRNATMSFSFDKEMNMKSLDVAAKFTTKEIMTKAGLNTLLGMGVVFAVLIFLALVISWMKYIPELLGQSDNKAKDVKTEVEKATPIVETQAETIANVSDDLELIAVITAAIAAQEGKSTDGFVVRSIRRRPSNNWN